MCFITCPTAISSQTRVLWMKKSHLSTDGGLISLPLTSPVLDNVVILSIVRYYAKRNLQEEKQVKSRNPTEHLLDYLTRILKILHYSSVLLQRHKWVLEKTVLIISHFTNNVKYVKIKWSNLTLCAHIVYSIVTVLKPTFQGFFDNLLTITVKGNELKQKKK